ncbi:MAG: hypothetical protein KC931_25425, partial [Candidatus Omnitrophica bacterium]|nr:hypothetical protein [Candidatus Omnitrophota bacterium]
HLEFVGTSEDTSWPINCLKENTSYCWRVDAVNDCSTTQGPIWSFTTGGDVPTPTVTPTPGWDTNDDQSVNAIDLIEHLTRETFQDPSVSFSSLFDFSLYWQRAESNPDR